MRPVVIIQARMGSSRLPGKVLMPILDKPMLWHIVDRLRSRAELADIVVATSTEAGDLAIVEFCRKWEISCFAGSESDVLDRFYQAALKFGGDPIFRITGDCPLVDPHLIGRLFKLYQTRDYDHVGIACGAGAIFLEEGRFPDGLDAECFSFAALEETWKNADPSSDREHVTPYMWRVPGRFRLGFLKSGKDYSTYRWTVDNQADLEVVRAIFEALYVPGSPFGHEAVIDFLRQRPDLCKLNSSFLGQEDYESVWSPESNKGE